MPHPRVRARFISSPPKRFPPMLPVMRAAAVWMESLARWA